MRLLILLGLLFSACATPYQPAGFSGGYTDEPIGKNRFLVSFDGNGYTSATQVRGYALRRARELCMERGFEEFEILDSKDGQSQYKTPDNVQCSSTSSSNYNGYGTTNNGYVSCQNYGGINVSKPSSSVMVSCSGPQSPTASTIK